MRTVHPADKTLIFEKMSIPSALATMAIPTIVSQLITLIYNIADTWFIGQTNNPYMVAASSLVLTVFLMTTALPISSASVAVLWRCGCWAATRRKKPAKWHP